MSPVRAGAPWLQGSGASWLRRLTYLGVAAVLVLGAVRAVTDARSIGRSWTVLLAFGAAVALGERFHFSIPGRREVAPIATASALALAMSAEVPQGRMLQLVPAELILTCGLGLALGAAWRRLSLQPVALVDVAVRLATVAAATAFYRRVPIGPRTLLQWQGHLPHQRWVVAVVMVLVAAAATALELALGGALHAERDHAPVVKSVVDDLHSAYGAVTLLTMSGPLIALAEYAVGLMALPLFLIPLALTQLAVRRYSSVRQTYRQAIRSLARLTELAGHSRPGHASRVTELAVAIGRDLGMPLGQLPDLEYAALLHDLGLVALREPIPGGATVLVAPSDQRRIASNGADIVRQTGVLDDVARILEAQTTPYRQVREFGEDLPLSGRIIKVANAFDDYSGGSTEHDAEEAALERLHLGLGYEYDPSVVDSLTAILERRPR